MFTRRLLVALAVALLSACSGAVSASPSPAPSPTNHKSVDFASLRQRALHLPAVTPGGPCPVSPHQPGTSVAPAFGSGPTFGNGPLYPLIGDADDDGIQHFGNGASDEGGWAYSKVLWIASPKYQADRILVRGHQLDGPNDLRFGVGSDPAAELLLEENVNARGGWNNLPSYTRFRAPGCYAYQVDGLDLSQVIVFKVVP